MPDWLYDLLNFVGWQEGKQAYKEGKSDNPYTEKDYAEYNGWQNGWWDASDDEN